MINLNFNDILSSLRHIRGGIPAVRLTGRIRLGEHRSLLFGPSHDLFDIQEFDPDRDPPNMKLDNFSDDDETEYARRCIESHEIKVFFLVDLSSSIDAGMYLIKRRMLLEAVGYIGATGARYQDPIGLAGFTDKIVLNLPARCGSNHLYHVLRSVYDFLDEHDPESKKISRRKTDFFTALDFVRRSFNKPCFIPIISDFVGFDKVVGTPLLKAVAAKHELVLIFLDDPLELTSAKGLGYLRMEDIEDVESGGQSVVSRRKLLELERELRLRRKELRKKKLEKMGIYSVVLEYSDEGRHYNRLRKFFLKRQRALSARRA